ncbi:hypothetical protein [Flavivirga aquatica]|nr:hypothetical protein [Flavivirga aquatica]
MRLKLLFDSHSPYRFKIDKLLFQKGDFIIDLKGCNKVLKSNHNSILIRELPYDCKTYIKED